MNKSESIKSIMPALLKAQAATTSASKDGKNTFFNNAKYATLESVIDAIKKPLNENGIVVLHSTSLENILTTTLLHVESCEWVSSETKLLMNKQDMQALGSAQTYCKRYHLTALLNLPCEDDDGNAAVNNQQKQQAKPEHIQKPVDKGVEQTNDEKVKAFAASLKIDDMKLKSFVIMRFGKPVNMNDLSKEDCKSFCEYLKREYAL